MPDSKQPRIFYVRENSGFHVACVAYQTEVRVSEVNLRNPADSPEAAFSRVKYAVSACNPMDRNVFSKKKARETALARLGLFRNKFTGSVEPGEKICERILADMLTKTFTVRDKGTDKVQHVPYPKQVLEAVRVQLTQIAAEEAFLAQWREFNQPTEIPTMEAPPEDEHP